MVAFSSAYASSMKRMENSGDTCDRSNEASTRGSATQALGGHLPELLQGVKKGDIRDLPLSAAGLHSYWYQMKRISHKGYFSMSITFSVLPSVVNTGW